MIHADVVVLLLFTALAQARDPLLWGSLEPGPYAVGFQSSIAFDASRKYDGRKARPILLDVWYPASNTGDAGLTYARYLRVPDVSEHPWFQDRLETFVRDVICGDLFHKKSEAALNQAERAAFDKLLGTHTNAHLDATPAQGSFPAVLYHSGAGGSLEDNSVLFEYLASHGYVVVSSAFQSPFPKFTGNNVGGMERSGPDLDFIARQTRRWPHADAAKLAAMGHSAGAQNILQWIGSPKCPARALVSLDTTLEYTPENHKGHKLLRDALRKLAPPHIPVLLFAQARLKPRFSSFDGYLRDSPHYEAEAAELSHDDFLTHGYLGRVLMQAPNAEAVRRSYEEVCRTIRTFLDVSLKGDAQAARALDQSAPSSPVLVRYRPAR
jgi:dienelactone hydrolase